MYIRYFLVLVFFTFSLIAWNQFLYSQTIIPGDSLNYHILSKQPGEVIGIMETDDGFFRISEPDAPNDDINVIVEFTEEPLFINKAMDPLSDMNRDHYLSVFSDFKNDLADLYSSRPELNGRQSAKIKKQYYKVFFGVSLTIPSELYHSVSGLDYVKKVHKDRIANICLDESVSLIRADSVWSQYGTEGDSIKIGILDTGIDYDHPSLGGGFGEGYKVYCGYDFVNEDDDPVDDNSHGTHVAGIAAGDGGGIKGVAPKAWLMAVKVMDAYGHGEESVILSGIEYALDPDDNDDYSDMADVLNISIGVKNGQPDDALATAVDNAVDIGMICCVAAGNDYSFNMIESPGSAAKAITVGATYKNDEIAEFSSRGPNKKDYSIKPDVLAPGVDIYSSVLNDSYAENKGTSMATPHVSGTVALIKKIHPEWDPGMIRSALMTGAVDIGEEAMAQGAGRIDALNAVSTSSFAVPSKLSYGIDDISLSIWTDSITVDIINSAAVSQDYSLSVDGISSGISLSAYPSSFTVASNDTQQVVFTLDVDNDVVPYPSEGSLAYSGRVNISGTNDTLYLPWAFVKASKLVVNFDITGAQLYMSHGRGSYFSSNAVWPDQFTVEMILPADSFCLLCTMNDGTVRRFIMRSGIAVEGVDTLEISSSEAMYKIEFKGVNEEGVELFTLPNGEKNIAMMFPDSSYYKYYRLSGNFTTDIYLSQLPDGFSVATGEFQVDVYNEKKVYSVNHGSFTELTGDVIVQNDPGDFIVQDLQINLSENYDEQPNITFFDLFIYEGTIYRISGFGTNFGISDFCWQGRIYINEDIDERGSFHTSFGANSFSIWAQPFRIWNDSVGGFPYKTPGHEVFLSPDNDTIVFNDGPVYPYFNHVNNFYGVSNICFTPFFYGQLNESRLEDNTTQVYYIYDGQSSLITTGILDDRIPLPVVPGDYSIEVRDTNYSICGVAGNAKLINNFDLTLTDPNPPVITSFQVRNSYGVPVERLETGEQAVIRFSLADFTPEEDENPYIEYHYNYQPVMTDSTVLYIKEFGTGQWQETVLSCLMEDTVIGYLYEADISDYTDLDSSALDVKIVLEDLSGNTSVWILEPAVAIGTFGNTEIPQEPDAGDPLVLHNYPNPFSSSTVIKFTTGAPGSVRLTIHDCLGEQVRILVSGTMNEGEHSVFWDGKSSTGSELPAGLYLIKLKTADKAAVKKVMLVSEIE